MKFIKIYGIQRTCTNYAEWLCKNNFKNVNVLRDEIGRASCRERV